MRLPARCLALACALTLALADLARAATLEGDWEGVIASPQRPWIIGLHMKRADGGWVGRMSIEDFIDLPLADVRAEGARVRFRLPPAMDSMVFEGTLRRAELAGTMTWAGEVIPARFSRVVPLPRPRGRVAAWRQDLDCLSTRFLDYDRSLGPSARMEFRRAITRLERKLSRLTDDEILVALSRAVALGGNAHTWLRLDSTRGGALGRRYPVRLWCFADGCYVIKASTAYRRTLGCRVVAIAGRDLSAARREIGGLFAGNAAWHDYLDPLFLTNPDVLAGLGWIRAGDDEAAFTFENERGEHFAMSLRSEPMSSEVRRIESWQDISPLTATGDPAWLAALPASDLPLYLRHPDKGYWFDYEPASGCLYFQFNRSGDDENGPSLREFGDSLLAFARSHPVRQNVIDLRFNSGGDLQVGRELMRKLAGEEKTGRRLVITGPCTFSAGLYHAAQLKQFAHATFVGEPVGDRLDFWAEGGHLVLPNSRAVVAYSNGFHRYSEKDYPENRPYYEELRIPTLAPDVAAPLTASAYFAGRDPALEAIAALANR